LVSNLAHPGGNVTGVAAEGSTIAAKAFGFLKEMVPNLSRVAFFGRSAEGIVDSIQRADLLAAGTATGIDVVVIDVTDPSDLRPYFAQAVARGAQAVYFNAYPYAAATVSLDVLNALSAGQKQQPTYNAAYLAANNNMVTNVGLLDYLALLSGLPAIWGVSAGPGIDTGSLLDYGESSTDGFRRAAYFVDDIVRGAKPQDLPVGLPTKYDLFINLKTANALGLVFPTDLLLTATQINE
jgi:putative ABC transport system substrate-binding protein